MVLRSNITFRTFLQPINGEQKHAKIKHFVPVDGWHCKEIKNVLCYVLIIVNKSKVQIKVHCDGKGLKRLLSVVNSISST